MIRIREDMSLSRVRMTGTAPNDLSRLALVSRNEVAHNLVGDFHHVVRINGGVEHSRDRESISQAFEFRVVLVCRTDDHWDFDKSQVFANVTTEFRGTAVGQVEIGDDQFVTLTSRQDRGLFEVIGQEHKVSRLFQMFPEFVCLGPVRFGDEDGTTTMLHFVFSEVDHLPVSQGG